MNHMRSKPLNELERRILRNLKKNERYKGRGQDLWGLEYREGYCDALRAIGRRILKMKNG